MPVTSPSAPTVRARRLVTTFYLYAFLDEFVLLYPVYALLFTDTGLSVPQISSLFVLWSLTGVVLEVPSGVLADAVSRRLLLVAAPLLGAVGFGLWVAAPSYWVFALGFVLWGARGALQSGAAEALVYDELDRLRLADLYGRVVGRASTAGLLGALLAIAVAAPVYAAGGYPAVGIASVLAGLLCAAVGLALPEHRTRASGVSAVPTEPGVAEGAAAGPFAILRVALAEARGNRAVRRALLILPVMVGVWGGLEEYVPLLAGEVVPVARVPLLVLLVWVGVMLGGLLTPLGQRLTARRFAGTVAAASIALALGALAGRPAGFVLVAVAFCLLQMTSLVAGVRLQESIGGPARATVTSLAGLGAALVTVGVYGGYALASTVTGHGVVFGLLAVPYLVLAVGLGRAGAPRRRQVGAGRGAEEPAAVPADAGRAVPADGGRAG
ncbi:MFS transporter [Plantactinospora sp. WMMB782]|uniref:MFS transporter n=1 Tax=Plantactinospora sp. WMMB782 TaxID=3404121 RepID=UPI003B958407